MTRYSTLILGKTRDYIRVFPQLMPCIAIGALHWASSPPLQSDQNKTHVEKRYT